MNNILSKIDTFLPKEKTYFQPDMLQKEESNIFTLEDTLKFLKEYQYPKNIFSVGEYWSDIQAQLKRSVIAHKLEMPDWLK